MKKNLKGYNYGNTVNINYEGEQRQVTVTSPHYNRGIGNEHYHDRTIPHISEINWDDQQGVPQVKGYTTLQHYGLVHNERPPKVGNPINRRLTFSEVWSDNALDSLGKFSFGKMAEENPRVRTMSGKPHTPRKMKKQ